MPAGASCRASAPRTIRKSGVPVVLATNVKVVGWLLIDLQIGIFDREAAHLCPDETTKGVVADPSDHRRRTAQASRCRGYVNRCPTEDSV